MLIAAPIPSASKPLRSVLALVAAVVHVSTKSAIVAVTIAPFAKAVVAVIARKAAPGPATECGIVIAGESAISSSGISGKPAIAPAVGSVSRESAARIVARESTSISTRRLLLLLHFELTEALRHSHVPIVVPIVVAIGTVAGAVPVLVASLLTHITIHVHRRIAAAIPSAVIHALRRSIVWKAVVLRRS